MTQHHDPVHPDDGDDAREPIPTLTTDDEAFLAGLLGGLPPLAMPPDVAAGLDAALAREQAERTATGVTEPADAAPEAAVGSATVVPLDQVRRRGQRRTRILQVAAAAVLVVAGGAVAVNVLNNGSSTSGGTANGASSPMPYSLHDTGHTYTAQTVDADVQSLAAGTLPTSASHATGASETPPSQPTQQSTESATGTPAPTATARISWTSTGLVACLAAVEGDTAHGVAPVAMDQGSYAGQAVLVIVLPGAQGARSYDVFIVGPACGQAGDADFRAYFLVPKP